MELQDLVAPALVEECYLICRHNLKFPSHHGATAIFAVLQPMISMQRMAVSMCACGLARDVAGPQYAILKKVCTNVLF